MPLTKKEFLSALVQSVPSDAPPAFRPVIGPVARLQTLAPGAALHYVIVRANGSKDKQALLFLADCSDNASLENFKSAWAGHTINGRPLSETESTWVVARGAFTVKAIAGKITTVPALRQNQVTAPSEVTAMLRDARKTMATFGVPVPGMERTLAGKVAVPSDTSLLGLVDAFPRAELENEHELVSKKGVQAAVSALVARFTQCGLREILTAYNTSKKAGGAPDPAAISQLKITLLGIATDADSKIAFYKAKTLSSARFGDSIKTLTELAARARMAVGTIDTLLNPAPKKVGKGDTVRAEVGKLLAKLAAVPPEDSGKKLRVLTDLYFASDMWLKHAGDGSGQRSYSNAVEHTALAAMREVYADTCSKLSALAGVTINNLPAWLEQNHGKGMEHHGTDLDVNRGLAQWMTAHQRNLFRVHVKGGKLYQYNWWTKVAWGHWTKPADYSDREPADLYKLVPVESERGSSAAIRAGYSGFVMAMNGDLFMGRQDYKYSDKAVYHSSYMAGLPVLMAGELLVENGVAKRVNTTSGHYRPPQVLVKRFLKMLAMQGVLVAEVAGRDNSDVKTVQQWLADFKGQKHDAVANAASLLEMDQYRHQLFFEKELGREVMYPIEGARKAIRHYNDARFDSEGKSRVVGSDPWREAFALSRVAEVAAMDIVRWRANADALAEGLALRKLRLTKSSVDLPKNAEAKARYAKMLQLFGSHIERLDVDLRDLKATAAKMLANHPGP